MTAAFWIDYDYDSQNASDGNSRFSAYVQQRADRFAEIDHDDPTAEFAAVAWRTATGPIMAPGFVRNHARVLSAGVHRSEWDGTLLADVGLVSPVPECLRSARAAQGGGYFRHWKLNSWDEYEGVGGQDLDGASYLLSSVQVLVKLPMDALPKIADIPTGRELELTAAEAVSALVDLMNQQIEPLIALMERA